MRNKMKNIVSLAVATVALLATSIAPAQSSGYWGAAPATLIAAGSAANSGTNTFSANVTNAYGIWPSAFGGPGAIVTAAGSALLEDLTNPVAIPINNSQKDLSLEFVANLAGGSGAGAGTNIMIRIGYTDQTTPVAQVATNGTANWTPNLATWFINPVTVGGKGSVDAIINLSTLTNATGGLLLSTAHGRFYIYDIAFLQLSNSSPYLTNYSLWWNAK